MADKKIEKTEPKLGDFIEFMIEPGSASSDKESRGIAIPRSTETDEEWQAKIDDFAERGKLGRVRFTKKDGEVVYNEKRPEGPDPVTMQAISDITAGNRPRDQKTQAADRKSLVETGMVTSPAPEKTTDIEFENAVGRKPSSAESKELAEGGLRPETFQTTNAELEGDKLLAEGAKSFSARADELKKKLGREPTAQEVMDYFPTPNADKFRTPEGLARAEAYGKQYWAEKTAKQDPLEKALAGPQSDPNAAPQSQPPPESEEQKLLMQIAGGALGPAPQVSGGGADLSGLKKSQQEFADIAKKANADTAASIKEHEANVTAARDAAKVLEIGALADKEANLVAQTEMKKKVEGDMAVRQQYLDEAAKAAATQVDPNRYWNNKSAGQKAMAAIAGALFGFSGQGMQWLQRLDSLVSEDMRAQESDRDSKVKGLTQQAAGMMEKIQQLRQLGLDEANARGVVADMKLQMAKSYIDQIGISATNAQMKARAAEMSMQIGQYLASNAEKYASLSQANAFNRARISLENAKLQQERDIERLKLGISMVRGEKPKKELPGPQSEHLASLRSGFDDINNTLKQLKKAGGWLSRNVSGAMAAVAPSIAPTEAKLFNDTRAKIINVLGRLGEAHALSNQELEFYSNQVPSLGDKDAEARFKLIQKMLVDKYNGYIRDYSHGYDMVGFERLPSGSDDEQKLGAKARE